eukprot:51116-Chlamydomonas_euryale.AAC.1
MGADNDGRREGRGRMAGAVVAMGVDNDGRREGRAHGWRCGCHGCRQRSDRNKGRMARAAGDGSTMEAEVYIWKEEARYKEPSEKKGNEKGTMGVGLTTKRGMRKGPWVWA